MRAGCETKWITDRDTIYTALDTLPTAETHVKVLGRIPAWTADYSAVTPHAVLAYRSPREYPPTQLVAELKG